MRHATPSPFAEVQADWLVVWRGWEDFLGSPEALVPRQLTTAEVLLGSMLKSVFIHHGWTEGDFYAQRFANAIDFRKCLEKLA